MKLTAMGDFVLRESLAKQLPTIAATIAMAVAARDEAKKARKAKVAAAKLALAEKKKLREARRHHNKAQKAGAA